MFSHRSVFAREIAFGVDKLNSLSTLISVSMCHSWSHSTAPAVLSVKLLCFRTQAGKGGTGRTCGLTKTSQILSCKRTRHHHKTFSVREDIIGRGFFPPRCKLQWPGSLSNCCNLWCLQWSKKEKKWARGQKLPQFWSLVSMLAPILPCTVAQRFGAHHSDPLRISSLSQSCRCSPDLTRGPGWWSQAHAWI